MYRIPCAERPAWQQKAAEYGFYFHTMYGERYWDESAYYQFSLQQIEEDLEAPTEELHQMCLDVVERVVADEQLLTQFAIPEAQWEFIRHSWLQRDPSLYSRLDFVYDGKHPAKLLENNADTPTSLYETGFWQWLWLEESVDLGRISRRADQFNSLQEKLVARFQHILRQSPEQKTLYFACCKGTLEDRGTVQYLEDCAVEAGWRTAFIFVEDIGLNEAGRFVDLADREIEYLFKLYPWEFMFAEAYAGSLSDSGCQFLEPPWKAVLSNKALLPMLWRMYPEHPNLLPAYFGHEAERLDTSVRWVRKPIYSREGANIQIFEQGNVLHESGGAYGQEGYIYQQAQILPRFGDAYTLVGSWLVDGLAAGISLREDSGPITQDMSRFLPHIIL